MTRAATARQLAVATLPDLGDRVARLHPQGAQPANGTPVIAADLYLRLSDLRVEDLDGDGRSKSLEHKERQLRDLAARLGWDVARVVIENDLMPRNGSGRYRNASAFKKRKIVTPGGRVKWRVIRPGFRSILDDIAAGRAAAMLAEDLDRAFRDPRDLEDLADVMREHKANARSLAGSLTFTDGGTDAEIMTARFLVAAANKSSADTARRVADARKRTAEAGTYPGGRRPYGLAVPPAEIGPDGKQIRGRLVVVPAEKAEIRRMADSLLAGVSLAAVTADLKERRVPTVTGAEWSPGTVRDVLLKPSIAGLAVHNRQKTARELARQGLPVPVDVGVTGPAQWEAILDEPTWRAVAELLTDPARKTTPGNTPRWLGSLIYRCGVCDDGATVYIGGGSVERQPSYVCRARSHLRRSAPPVDQFVTEVLVRRLARPDAAELITVRQEADAPALHAEAAELRERLDRQARLHARGVIDDRQLAAGSAEVRPLLEAVKAKLSAVVPVRDPLEGIAGRSDAARVWAGLPLGHQREILRTLMDVTLLKGKPGRYPNGAYFDDSTVRIEWKR